MQTIERKLHNEMLWGNFENGVIYKGDYDEYQNWLQVFHENLQGETFESREEPVAIGDGFIFEVYGDNDNETVAIWYDTIVEGGEDLYYFGSFEK